MNIIPTEFPSAYLIAIDPHQDARGAFQKPFQKEVFRAHGLETEFSEMYYSVSSKGVLRGMHFQTPPSAYAKLVYVSHGRVLDVALDIRKGSPTYGKALAKELSLEAATALYLPSGFAHGFLSLEDGSVVNYAQTAGYDPAHDGGIRLDSFGFDWGVASPILSDRDKTFPTLAAFDSPFDYEVRA